MAVTYTFQPKRKRSFFGNFSVNTNLIFLNLIFFVLAFILIANGLAIENVAIKPANIFQGKYVWTFLTSMFMHGNFLHLFVNMFSLFFIGSLVEKLIGSKRYLWFYLLSGIFAGLFFVIISYIMLQFGYENDFNTFAVGASGALFALVGFLMLITPNLPVYIMLIPIPIKMKYAAPGLLIVLWLISIAGSIPIGNTAHLGGLIAGLIYGIHLRNKYKNKTRWISKHFS